MDRPGRAPVAWSGTGPMPKYDAPMLQIMQFRITPEQKQWLLDQRTGGRGMSDVLRELIDEAMKQKEKK